jgi:hypothetical protein
MVLSFGVAPDIRANCSLRSVLSTAGVPLTQLVFAAA